MEGGGETVIRSVFLFEQEQVVLMKNKKKILSPSVRMKMTICHLSIYLITEIIYFLEAWKWQRQDVTISTDTFKYVTL